MDKRKGERLRKRLNDTAVLNKSSQSQSYEASRDTSEPAPPNPCQRGRYSIYLQRLSRPGWLGTYRDVYLSADSHPSK